jgi:hypothetical protein
MASTLRPQSIELLNNIALLRRLRDPDGEANLYEDWKRLVRWLQSELRNLAPALRNWGKPWVAIDANSVSVNVEPDASWTSGGQSVVCFYFSIFRESLFEDHSAPNVGLWINLEWEHCDALRAILQAHGRPAGFVSAYSDDGITEQDCPFWRSLPLQDFQISGTFDLQRFVKEIAAAFESLAAARPIVDGYLAAHLPGRPLVPPLRKALILDLETWGAGNPDQDEIIEVGLILTAYDSGSGELVGVCWRSWL